MPERRIAKALRLLRIDRDSDPIELADALWLASQLPAPVRVSRGSKPKPKPEHAEDDLGKKTARDEQQEEPPPTATSQAAPPEDTGKLFAPLRPKPQESADRATYVKVAAGHALPQRLEIERALKPFLRRFFSRRSSVLDEQATAERSAEERRIEPMFRPAPERWFDVALIVEDNAEMRVWADTLRQLDALMQRHGAFRQVRSFQYRVAGGRVQLTHRYGQPVQPKFLTDPENRRLCLIVTNGADPSWREIALATFVRDLGRNNVVAILQMLPRRLWPHTALGDAVDWVYSKEPGAPNRKLWVQDPFGGPDTVVPDADYAPVLTLQPEELKQWAHFVQSPRRVTSNAVLLTARAPIPAEPRAEARAETLVREFRGIASPQAFRLLRLAAAALPLTVPILRLLQEGMSGGQQTVHLAEVLFSGLIRRETEEDGGIPLDEVYFDFAPGVRDLLLDTLSSGEQKQAEEALEPARERLGKYLEEKTGLSDIRVLLRDKEGSERLPESARAFLEVNRRVLERLRPAPVDTPRQAAVTAMQFSSGGRWLVVGRENGQVEVSFGPTRWQAEFSGNSDPITAIAADDGSELIAAGTSTGKILVWNLVGGKPLRELATFNIPIRAMVLAARGDVQVYLADGRVGEFRAQEHHFFAIGAVSRSASRQLWGFGGDEFLVGDGRELRLFSRMDRAVARFPRVTTVAAVSPDGFLAVDAWPELHIYQVLEDRLSRRLGHVLIPEHRQVALSPGGQRAAYVAADGSIGFVEVPRQALRPTARKAQAPRNVVFIRGEDMDLTRAILDDIVDSGHRLVRDSRIADWLVVQRPAAAHPLIDEWIESEREVIYIADVSQIAHALDAIDLPPLGPLVGFEPPILNDLPRTALEDEVERLFLQPPHKRLGFSAPTYSGASNVLTRAARRPNVRELYSGGIYRGAEKLPKRPGRKLLLYPLQGIRLEPGDLEVRRVSQRREPDLRIGNATDAEANAYLWQATEMNLSYRRLTELKTYHDNVPRLVCLCAGLLKRFGGDWRPPKGPARVKDKYEAGVRQIVNSLKAPMQRCLLGHAVMKANPPAHLAKAFEGDELRDLARSCRWLYASPGPPALPLLATARQAIQRVGGNEAAGHELIVLYYEDSKGDLAARFQDRYWAEHLIAHASAAGGGHLVERLLRRPHLLERFLSLPPAEFREQISPFVSRNRFLANLSKALTERLRSGAAAPGAAEQILRIDDTVRSEGAKPRRPRAPR